MLSSAQPPRGYEWSNPSIRFEASKFPEFDKNQRHTKSWTYQKIDIHEDAFHGGQGDDNDNDDDDDNDNAHAERLEDPALEKYASTIRDYLRTELSATMQKNESTDGVSTWECRRIAVVQKILDHPKSVAAIQGTLRMSGLFEKRRQTPGGDDGEGSSDSAR